MEVRLNLFPILIVSALITLCTSQKQILDPENDICRFFKDDIILRKPGTCSESIICKDFKSLPHTNCGNKVWDRNSQKCVKTTKDKYCKTACTAVSPRFVRDRKNCHGWNECRGPKQVARGECNDGLHFDQQRQLCVYANDSKCVAKYNFCDVVPKNIPFKDEYNCHKYYQCNPLGSLRSVNCEVGKYFDPVSSSCIAKAQVDCYKHPYPENVCGDNKLPLRNQFVSDGATCRGYFYCKDQPNRKPDTAPIWGQCPKELFFEPDEQICTARTHVKCDEDRCDGVKNGKALSSRDGCQHYLICNNGYTISEEYCGDDMYYDAINEECTSQRTSYRACSTHL